MKKSLLVAIISGLALGVQAGDWAKAPVDCKVPVENCEFGASVAAGYGTDFIFQGSRHGRDNIWTQFHYTVDTLVPVTLGATYYNLLDDNNLNGVFGDFLHTYAIFNLGEIAGFNTSFAYNHVFFPEDTGAVVTATSQAVLTLNVSRDLGFATLLLGTAYSSGGDGSVFNDSFSGGWYHSAGLQKAFELTDCVSLVLESGVGYSDDYWVHYWNSGWANYYVKAALPIKVGCKAVITPYLGFNGGMDDNAIGFESSDALDLTGVGAGGGDVFHGGVSVNIPF